MARPLRHVTPGQGRTVIAWLCAECLEQISGGPPQACNDHPFAGRLMAMAIVARTKPWRDSLPSSFSPTGRHHPDRITSDPP